MSLEEHIGMCDYASETKQIDEPVAYYQLCKGWCKSIAAGMNEMVLKQEK